MSGFCQNFQKRLKRFKMIKLRVKNTLNFIFIFSITRFCVDQKKKKKKKEKPLLTFLILYLSYNLFFFICDSFQLKHKVSGPQISYCLTVTWSVVNAVIMRPFGLCSVNGDSLAGRCSVSGAWLGDAFRETQS